MLVGLLLSRYWLPLGPERGQVHNFLFVAAAVALLPVLTSAGHGSDVMVPMAIPSFGGMLVVLLSIFVVPVLYAAVQERRLKAGAASQPPQP